MRWALDGSTVLPAARNSEAPTATMAILRASPAKNSAQKPRVRRDRRGGAVIRSVCGFSFRNGPTGAGNEREVWEDMEVPFSFPGSAWERTTGRLCLPTVLLARQSLADVRSRAEPGNEGSIIQTARR